MTQATIIMENGGEIVLELDPGQAPATVENFEKLAGRHFYDGLIFHRVISGFMIQGGCPEGTGTGGPGYQIKGEFRSNGIDNRIRHERGVISMARSMNPDSAGSQFFIMHQAATHLDGQYAAFGRVVKGMEVVDQIASSKTSRQDRPLIEQKIKSIRIEKTE
jgi:peptidyl-prolyl cis-trans isomerase B (cyclophilin B)